MQAFFITDRQDPVYDERTSEVVLLLCKSGFCDTYLFSTVSMLQYYLLQKCLVSVFS